MKIAFVSNLLEPTGGDDILLNHVKCLKRHGHDVTAYFSGVMDAAKEKYNNDLSLVTIFDPNKISNLKKYDIVISNGLLGVKILNRANIDGLCKAHFLQNFDPWIFGKTKDVDDIYKSLDKILLYSSHLQRIVKHYYGSKNFIKCNNGIDYTTISKYRSDVKNKSVCFCVAYYRPYKGIKLANEVFGILKNKGFRTVEICSVNGPMDNTMEFYRNPCLERKCEIISQCGVMLHPSVFETWNLVSMESMALGTPVVGTNSKGIMEYATPSNSIILDNRDAGTLANKIENLWEDKNLYDKLREEGIKTAMEYDWKTISRSIEDCYCKLLDM